MADRESQQLAAKDAGLFRQVVKFYESKQYKKGLKAADQILKKHPSHGETLAMKGLILCYQEKKEEAYELVRRGLRADLKSHVCWHVYGLLWRADNNYEEAIKCYKNALRIDTDNLQILRDLAQLQVQMRDYVGFIDTRQTLLHLKASNRNNWISFAIAHHLNKNYDMAVQILSGFESTQEGAPKGEEYEHSEMLFYKAMILEEGGRTEAALEQLEQSRDDLKDGRGFEEARARLLLKKGALEEAESVYWKLLGLNADNHRYHDGLRESLRLPRLASESANSSPNASQLGHLKELYERLKQMYPDSSTAKRIPLDFLNGRDFEDALYAYMKPFLVKGIPSLFSDLKGLYRNAEKVQIIEQRLTWLVARLRQEPSILPTVEGSASASSQPAGAAAFWSKVLLARHYDRLGQTAAALDLVEECSREEEGEDAIEVWGIRSRILKHAGDLEGAAAAAVRAQSLDQADRYLNSVAAKALFRAGHIERAEKMAARFTKDSDQPDLLHEMQCMWYEIECGAAFLPRKDYGRALKNFTAVLKHFATFQEDQFDFHSYCVRKMTLRSYISMLRMEDGLLENHFYAKAACAAIDTYLELADAPARQQQSLKDEEALLAAMSLEDQKKHKLRRKKEAQKRAKEEDKRHKEAAAGAEVREKEVQKPSGGKKTADKGREKDTDPDGSKLAAVQDPLAEAAKLLQRLRENSAGSLRTHLLSFEVAMRRGKQLLALQAVKQAISLAGKSHPDVHRILVRFCSQARGGPGSQNGNSQGQKGHGEVVQEVLSSQVGKLLDGADLASIQEAYSKTEARQSLAQAAAFLESQLHLHPGQREKRLSEFLANHQPSGSEAAGGSLSEAVAVHRMLSERLQAPEAADAWAARCREAHPWASHFGGEKATQPSVLDGLLDGSGGRTTPSVLRAQDL